MKDFPWCSVTLPSITQVARWHISWDKVFLILSVGEEQSADNTVDMLQFDLPSQSKIFSASSISVVVTPSLELINDDQKIWKSKRVWIRQTDDILLFQQLSAASCSSSAWCRREGLAWRPNYLVQWKSAGHILVFSEALPLTLLSWCLFEESFQLLFLGNVELVVWTMRSEWSTGPYQGPCERYSSQPAAGF